MIEKGESIVMMFSGSETGIWMYLSPGGATGSLGSLCLGELEQKAVPINHPAVPINHVQVRSTFKANLFARKTF